MIVKENSLPIRHRANFKTTVPQPVKNVCAAWKHIKSTGYQEHVAVLRQLNPVYILTPYL
jgi:hypothetical protein